MSRARLALHIYRPLLLLTPTLTSPHLSSHRTAAANQPVHDPMLVTAMHTMDPLHAHSSSSSASPPWLPVLADHHHQFLYDVTASATPSPPPPAAAAPPHRGHHRPASRRLAKRRPRPSRRLPTTYITADPASFRRMVHQVTGADHLPQPPTPSEILCRPSPASGALVLPTLDTSAFLIGAAGVFARTGTDAPSNGPIAGLAPAPAFEPETGGVGACNNSGSNCGGFPTLESWDALF